MTHARRHRRRGKERGTGLMEGLVSIGVMMVILVIIAQIFGVSYDIYVKQVARAENDTGAILAARSISEAVRGASSVLSSATINSTAYVASEDVLIVETPSIDANALVIPGEFDRVAIFRDGTDPTRILSDTEVGAGSARPSGQRLVTPHNEALVFRYAAADIEEAERVSVYIVNSQIRREQTFTTRAWTSLFLRNH